MFQGVGKGMYALYVTVLRTIVFSVIFTLLFAIPLGMGLTGVWWGLSVGNIMGSVVAFSWARYLINCFVKDAKERADDAMCIKITEELS
jgi:Na+-driven multidrug efflux pump